MSSLRIRFVSLAIVALISTNAPAAEQTAKGKIKSVDIDKKQITLDDLEIDVSRKTKITVKGKKATFEDIEVGQEANVVYDDSLDAAISISIGKQSDVSGKNADSEGSGENGEVSLFDGKTLNGWHGSKFMWKVKNGVIVGNITSSSKNNLFLISDKKYKDFKLRLKFRLLEGNSGVQVRSKEQPNFAVTGPQADICGKFLGCLTGEGMTPAIIKAPTDEIKEQLKKEIDLEEWNEMQLLVEGESVVIKINGIRTVNVLSDDIPSKGVIAFQLHAGGRTTVEFKDIFISAIDSE